MAWRITLACCLALLVLAGCKKKEQDVQVQPKPQQRTATAALPSPPTPSTPSGESTLPEKASEQQDRALRRYNENTWFVQQAMQLGAWDERQTVGVSKLVKAATPDWDHANPTHAEIRGPDVATKLQPWLETARKLQPAKQAAALLVADRIVVMEEEDGNLEPQGSQEPTTRGEASGKPPKSTAQMELERLGARFSYEPGSERYLYTLNWL